MCEFVCLKEREKGKGDDGMEEGAGNKNVDGKQIVVRNGIE